MNIVVMWAATRALSMATWWGLWWWRAELRECTLWQSSQYPVVATGMCANMVSGKDSRQPMQVTGGRSGIGLRGRGAGAGAGQPVRVMEWVVPAEDVQVWVVSA